jgi:hypothetical protein
VLGRVQRGLEQLYRIDTSLEVDDFVIDDDDRLAAAPSRAPREQLLVRQDDDGLAMGLYVDRRALAVLDQDDPSAGLHDGNLGEFLLVVEGVSHFVYLAWRAQRSQPVRALELELQAEVDKYVTCLLAGADASDGPAAARSAELRRRLFEEFSYEDDLDDDERDRYRVANDQAARYAASLERRYVARRRVADMLDELRRFWRLPLDGKLDVCRDD